MKASFNEEGAWALVLATPVGEDPVRIARPRHPGVEIEVDAEGRWSSAAFASDGARRVLDLYLPLRRRASWVMAQMGQSLDGRIATESGHSHYVTGPEDIRRLHRLRALADAVLVGAGTASSDDPRLTVREVEGPDPVRVVLDSEGRLDPQLRVFRDGRAPTLVLRARDRPEGGPRRAGVEELRLPADPSGGFAPGVIVAALRERGLGRILVEGGGITVSRFLEAGVLDRLHVTVAPLLLGSGRPAFTLQPVDTMHQALRPACRTFPLGKDVLFDLDLRARPGDDAG